MQFRYKLLRNIFVFKHWLSAHQQLIFISRKTLQLMCIKDKVYLFRDLA